MPFKKGDPNINRKGRPKKGQTFSDQIEKEANIMMVEGFTKKEALVKILFKEASKGNLKAIEMIIDRTDGKPQSRIDLSNEDQSFQSISPHMFVSTETKNESLEDDGGKDS